MRRAYIELHLAVLLFGFTAILGKLITLPTVSLVWWRVGITTLSLLLLMRIVQTLRTVPLKRMLQYTGIGCIVALHWMTFFGSIKASNASIALVALATTSFFTSLVEPLVMHVRVRVSEILLGLLIIPAMVLVVHQVDPSMHTGIWLGLASAMLASLFASFNKRLISYARPLQITFFEISSAWVFISISLLIMHLAGAGDRIAADFDFTLYLPTGTDWLYLIILALVCTTLAYVLAVRALHHLSAFASNLVINLEPVYGILLAWLVLKENRELTPGFYLGVFIIVGIVFFYPVLRKWRKEERQP